MADRLVVHDDELETVAGEVYDRLDTSSKIDLYTNDYQPESDDLIGVYTVASYTGYSQADVSGLWTGPYRDEAGAWSFHTEIVTFAAPTAGGNVTVYGWILQISSELRYASKLETPVEIVQDGEPYRIRITLSPTSGKLHAERVC